MAMRPPQDARPARRALPPALLAVVSLLMITLLLVYVVPDIVKVFVFVASGRAESTLIKNTLAKDPTKTLDHILPAHVQWKAHNYNHLHEAPTLFYAVAIVLAIIGQGDGFNTTLAWAYVGLRVIHSLIQVLELMLLRQVSDVMHHVKAMVQDAQQPDFDFEAAGNVLSLLLRLRMNELQLPEADEWVEQIALRFCTSKASTDMLAMSVQLYQPYADLVHQVYKTILEMAEQALGHVRSGDPTAALKALVIPSMLIVLILGSIFFGIATPTESAAVGVAGALLPSLIKRRWERGMLRGAATDALKATAMILWITLGAKAYVAIFTGLGGADTLLQFIQGLDVNRWLILAAMMLLLVFLGTVLDELGIILLTVPVFLPIVRLLGFDELWFGVLYAITIQMGYISPPFGYTLFYIKGTLPSHIGMNAVYWGILPFFGLQFVGLLICAAFPDLVTYLPRLMASR